MSRNEVGKGAVACQLEDRDGETVLAVEGNDGIGVFIGGVEGLQRQHLGLGTVGDDDAVGGGLCHRGA